MAEQRRIHQIALHEPRALDHGRAMPLVETVVDDYLVPVAHQLLRHHAADVTRPTRYENTHLYPFSATCAPAIFFLRI
jgi:hypothetical protein